MDLILYPAIQAPTKGSSTSPLDSRLGKIGWPRVGDGLLERKGQLCNGDETLATAGGGGQKKLKAVAAEGTGNTSINLRQLIVFISLTQMG